MTKRKRKPAFGPHWLADWTISAKNWRLALPLAAGAWMWHHWRGVGSVLLALLILAATDQPVLAGFALLLIYGLVKWRPMKKAGWWDHDTLSTAFVAAGTLRKEGDALPTLSYQGKVEHTEHGDAATVGLPQAKGLDDVNPRRLAAALRVPANRLAVSQDEDHAANVVTVYVGKATKTATPATIADAARAEWSAPVRIGFNPQGEPIELATSEHNTLVAGRPGSGKTSLSRIILAHYLLDPATRIFLLDGKGSTDDYGTARPMCEQFVSGTDDGAVPDTLAMLTDVLDVVRSRNALGGDHPGVLLLLEEFQDVRAAAGRDQRDQLDRTLGRIVRMGRAVSVHVLVSTQRPTTDDLPAGTRNLLSQRVALMLRNGQDAALVLGLTPQLALPKRRGQALFTDGGPVVGAELDRLTDDAWRKVCKRAAALRGDTAPFRPTLVALPSVRDGGVVGEVREILAANGPTTTATLHSLLTDETRASVGDVRDLGLLMGQCPEFERAPRTGEHRNARPWQLVEAPEQSARV